MRRGSAELGDIINVFCDTTRSAREALDHVRHHMLNKRQRDKWCCRGGRQLITAARDANRIDILAVIAQEAPRDVKRSALYTLAMGGLTDWVVEHGTPLPLHLEDSADVQYIVFHAAACSRDSLGPVLQCVTPAAALAPVVKTMVNQGFERARSQRDDSIFRYLGVCNRDMYSVFRYRVIFVDLCGVEVAGAVFLHLAPLMGESVVEFVEMIHVLQMQDHHRHVNVYVLNDYLLQKLSPLAGLYREIQAVRAALPPGVLRRLVINHLERLVRHHCCCWTIEK